MEVAGRGEQWEWEADCVTMQVAGEAAEREWQIDWIMERAWQ